MHPQRFPPGFLHVVAPVPVVTIGMQSVTALPKNPEPMNPPQNLKNAFCARFEYPQDKFEKRIFWSALHPEMKPLAFLIDRLRPDFFKNDLDFIRSLGTAETKQEVRIIVNSLHYDPTFERGFLRGFLRLRISRRRLTRIASEVLVSGRSQTSTASSRVHFTPAPQKSPARV
jgi:hypothetical protein